MPDTPIYKADAELTKLIERARAGEEVFVATPDDHKARLVPVDEIPASTGTIPRQAGLLRGKLLLADDWDSPETNAEIERLFYEGDKFPPGRT